MSKRIRGRQCLILFIIAAAIISLACAATNQPARGDSAATATPPPQSTQTAPQANASTELNKKAGGSATPALADGQEAVKRVYQDTVVIDTSRSAPFITGDFNGDGSQDIAVIVKPAKGALPKLNSEYANWIVEDPRKIVLPDPNKAVQQLPKAPVTAGVQQEDTLLLILHGYRQEGWHHNYARQTFLLRNAVGENIRAQSLNEVAKAANAKNAPPHHPGDVIREKLAGQEGFLYWTNAKYAWHE
jgi:hypothetical protein